VSLSLMGCAVASAQAMVERGAAAIAGSSGGVALGKGVAGVLQKVDQQLGQSTKTAAPAVKKEPLVELPKTRMTVTPDTPVPDHGSAAAPGRRAPRRVAATRAVEPLPQAEPVPVVPAVPAKPPVTVEELAQLSAGLSRQEVLSKAGDPWWRLTIPDGSHAVEIYRYRANGQDAAVVQLNDGVVTDVKLLAR
jgi:hypothetical protein